MIGIYKITSPTSKVYIGQSTNITERFTTYKRMDCKAQTILYRSLKKHGCENHIFEIIEECEESKLNERERYWQDYYNVVSVKGLNCRLTKTTDKSGKLSEETKKRLSKSRKGWKMTQEAKDSISKGSKKIKEVIDITTGIVYRSVVEVGKVFNLDRKALSNKLRGAKRNNTQFEYVNHNNKGRAFEADFISPPFKRKIINIETGETYGSIKETCLINNLSIGTLTNKLNGWAKNNTSYRYEDELVIKTQKYVTNEKKNNKKNNNIKEKDSF